MIHQKYIAGRVLHRFARPTWILHIWRVNILVWYIFLRRKLRVRIFRYWIESMGWYKAQIFPMAAKSFRNSVVHPHKSLRHVNIIATNLRYIYMVEFVLISSFHWYIICLPSTNSIAVAMDFLNNIVQPINQFRVKVRGFPRDVRVQHRVLP